MAELNTDITLYSINKQAMNEEKPLDIIEFNVLTKKIADYITEEATKAKKTFWMLLCHERRDYTIFIPLTAEGILNEIRPTLNNRGKTLSIDHLEDGNFEIWIRDPETNENFVYYLFDYTTGILKA